jgi:nucleoside-diphosphate-sugar epimerase
MVVGKTVCVTGASGFIASWLVKLLLERGYTVRGTIRNPEKAKFLLQLPGASDRLKLFSADLLEPGSFDEAVAGCDGVFHVASPIVKEAITDPQAQFIEPAVNGTLNVLASCAKVHTQRVVLTSSVGAINRTPKCTPEIVVDESFWSEEDYCRERKDWYVLSKTLAEKAAWDFVKEKGLDMVVINPSGVIGPTLQASELGINKYILGLLNGTMKAYPNLTFGVVGVKDVAMAHILAYESQHATGRYICSGPVLQFADVVSLLRKLYPMYDISAKVADEAVHIVPPYNLSSQKLRDLGLHVQPIEDVIYETVASFKEWGLLD